MYFEPGRSDHQLPFDPFKSCVVHVLFIANQRAGGGRKDSVVNAEQRGKFVWNMATYALRDAVNTPSRQQRSGYRGYRIWPSIGHPHRRCCADQWADRYRAPSPLGPLARLGYFEYTAVHEVFEMRPPPGGALAAGMEGSAQKFRRAEADAKR